MSSLCKYIIQSCSDLKLYGLMTIEAIAESNAISECHENEEFVGFKKVKDAVADELGIELELRINLRVRCGVVRRQIRRYMKMGQSRIGRG